MHLHAGTLESNSCVLQGFVLLYVCVEISTQNSHGVFYYRYIFTHLHLLHITDYQDVLKYCSFVFLPVEIFIAIFKSWSKGHVHLKKLVLFAKVLYGK